jgi:DNA-directed RNA polymerase alpha subunit
VLADTVAKHRHTEDSVDIRANHQRGGAGDMMRYIVDIKKLQKGCVYVEAPTAQLAVMKAKELYQSGDVDWYGDEIADIRAVAQASSDENDPKIGDRDISVLKLTTREFYALKRGGINSIGQLTEATEWGTRKDELLKVRNLGVVSADGIIKKYLDYIEKEKSKEE